VKSVAWAPDGGLIATSDADGWIAVWRWPGTEPEREIQIATSAVETVRWLGDGATIAAALRNGKVVLWSVRDGTTTELKGGHPDTALGLAVDRRGNRLISSGDGGEVLLWDLARREQVATLPSTQSAGVPPMPRDIVALDRDGRTALVAGNDGNLIVYDLDALRIHKVLPGNSPQIEGAAFNADASMTASVSADGFLDIRMPGDAATFATVKVYPNEGRPGADDGRTFHLRRLTWLPEYDAIAIATSSGEIKVVSHDVAAWQRRLRMVFRLN
jgi:WD40 repeat protein